MRLSVVRRYAKESIDLDYMDLLYTLQLFMSGSASAIQEAMEGKVLRASVSESGGGELPNYSDILPGIGQVGLQNHGLVNARINVQGLTLEPELTFSSDNPMVREYNASFFLERSQQLGWSEHWYMAGMELEANGIASCRAGVTDGRVDWRHTTNLDCLWDRAKRAPANYRWAADRDRLTPEEVDDIYGHALTDAEFDQLAGQTEGARFVTDSQQGCRRTPMRQIIEWQWYSPDYHVVFLGSMFGSDSVALKWDPNKGRYERITEARSDRTRGRFKTEGEDLPDGECGPNPFGVIPKAWWVDSWAPGIHRPVSKLETTMRLAAMLSEVEYFMIETMRNGVPITAVDGSRVDPDLLEELKTCKSVKALKKLIVTNGGSVNELLSRTPAMQLPDVALHLRSFLKEEINAATGVGDMQRGQALGGERRTRKEVEMLADAAGVQARHLRKTFARFLEDVVNVTRAIGSVHDTAETQLHLPSYGMVKTSEVPAATMLGMDLPVQVSPASLVFKTEEERREEAIAEFQILHVPYIQLQVMDPRKSMEKTMRAFGYKDPQSQLGLAPAAPALAPPPGEPAQEPAAA